ncbi:helix-turn-helix domain-containing protein [Pseudomonas sichuanensis]|uniref:helix-turn-helix domain-containing protein n=1 Tax=Pseudomonas sichuanensis TaxID=2213015 RepID=UPI002B40708A|nr:helix-turn-helix domain-containing protein [Pseudomonas sichuanensis]
MEIYEDTYRMVNKHNPANEVMLTATQLDELNARISANADHWLANNAPRTHINFSKNDTQPLKSNRGVKPKMVANPLYGFIGCTTHWGRYPEFAIDIIEGIARLDWHDRAIEVGGKSMPLSVRNLVLILESLPIITNEAVERLLQLQERHARRYVKAVELIVPWIMKNRPRSLRVEMGDVAIDNIEIDRTGAPSANELAKLHYDLRTFTKYNTAEEYEADYPPDTPVATFPQQQVHPKKSHVLDLLATGMKIAAVHRETGVSRVTINKWRSESHLQLAA